MMAGVYPLVMSDLEQLAMPIERELMDVINALSLDGKERLLRRAKLLLANDTRATTEKREGVYR